MPLSALHCGFEMSPLEQIVQSSPQVFFWGAGDNVYNLFKFTSFEKGTLHTRIILMSKTCTVQNPFDKHRKQVMMHYLSRSDWKRSVQVKASQGSPLYCCLISHSPNFPSLRQNFGTHLFDETQYSCWCVMSLCVAVHDWGVFITYYLQTDQMKKPEPGKCCLFLVHLSIRGESPSKRETLGYLVASSWWCSDLVWKSWGKSEVQLYV